MTANLTAKLDVAALDIRKLARFFNSAAHARATAEYTKLTWKEDRESTVLNILYGAMPWKGRPGWVEIIYDEDAAQKRAEAYALQYQDKFYSKLAISPADAGKYARLLEKTRDDYLETVRQIYQEAADINREVVKETTRSLIALRSIKIGASLAVSYGSAGALPIAYTVATGLIDAFDDLGKAAIVTTLDVGSGLSAEHAAKAAAGRISKEEILLKTARTKIAELNNSIMRKTSTSKTAKLGRGLQRQVGAANTASANIQTFGKVGAAAKAAGKILPLVFVIPDVMDLIEDYRSLH